MTAVRSVEQDKQRDEDMRTSSGGGMKTIWTRTWCGERKAPIISKGRRHAAAFRVVPVPEPRAAIALPICMRPQATEADRSIHPRWTLDSDVRSLVSSRLLAGPGRRCPVELVVVAGKW
jgi:hypothetical protein